MLNGFGWKSVRRPNMVFMRNSKFYLIMKCALNWNSFRNIWTNENKPNTADGACHILCARILRNLSISEPKVASPLKRALPLKRAMELKIQKKSNSKIIKTACKLHQFCHLRIISASLLYGKMIQISKIPKHLVKSCVENAIASIIDLFMIGFVCVLCVVQNCDLFVRIVIST